MEIRDIIFNEELHRYTDSYDNVYTSTTTCIHEFEPKMDKDYWLKRKALERNVSTEVIAKEWEQKTNSAIENGKTTHDYLETSINIVTNNIKNIINSQVRGNEFKMITIYDVLDDNNIGLVDTDKLLNSDLKNRFPIIYNRILELSNNGYRFYAEICVYSTYYLISGAIDLLAIKFNNDVPESAIILDWKTNKEKIRFEAGYYIKDNLANYTGTWRPLPKAKLLYPLSHLPKSNGSIYGLQLNTYAYLVELAGLPVTYLEIFHIRTKEQIKIVELRDIEEETEVVNIEIPNMRNDVQIMLAKHYVTNVKNKATYQAKLL